MKQSIELFIPLADNHYLQVATAQDDISEIFEEMMQGVDGYDLVMAKKMHMWGNGL
ncbi:hypothetical protein HUE87_11485 [Candidatus Sulfurimonas marisnigri]|uniref:Uncharacterized protein n=1 Tax=Candidatus Sulfurimonas marisnigri TaxID=2740405 RepID=A0A7S7RQH6_9BACT|nr:hypothetical protein [Candidatus Sulfurimonas marisnigri]QOY54480.1 hypothetical protein HUE87_11485 [Candidatus Sulfurimonas marisnigri]